MKKTVDGGRLTVDRAVPLLGENPASTPQDVARRDVVKMLGAATVAAFGLAAPDVARAAAYAGAALQQGAPAYKPIFFTRTEWPMVRSLADLVIPADARSGSASDAGVPEFMDFIMMEFKGNQKWMRDGLQWLNAEGGRRFKKGFIACTAAQQTQVLDDIAFPKKAPAALKPGVEFFTRFRDMTASGFWSSRVGYKDIGYMGNMIVPVWEGCPEPQLKKLGVSYKMSMKAVRRG
ncbi:MAG: gluconate 2-dehydrogenase subunit 3 family protein [Gemmatimonadetes bacterium]|nr:gluconate 2-dehydrogenase subunit 3 family protein [Gemmatimonadota bacterium]